MPPQTYGYHSNFGYLMGQSALLCLPNRPNPSGRRPKHRRTTALTEPPKPARSLGRKACHKVAGIADFDGMSPSTATVRAPVLPAQRVRYRCLACEVAWTAVDDENCWICGQSGDSLRTALALREDDHLHLDFQ